jgi:hypothetical protein
MAKALLIADQHRISPEMKDRYARAGIIHYAFDLGFACSDHRGSVLLLLRLARMPPNAAALGPLW